MLETESSISRNIRTNLGALMFHFLKYKNLFRGNVFLLFSSLGLKTHQVVSYYGTQVHKNPSGTFTVCHKRN